jgi:LysM repeat protein
MAAYGMDRNERLLSRIQQERSGHGRLLGVRSEWLLAGSVVLVVAAAAAGFRLITVSGAGGEPLITHSSDEALTSTSPEPTSQTASTATLPAATRETVLANTRPPRYLVRPGDSLESIAGRNGVSAVTLASVNDLDDPDLLQPGLELVVPTTDGVVHIVERGETLRTIAERFDVDIATLVSANDLPDPDHIAVGLRLFIPGARAPVDAQPNSR